jgi:hypothetical protein
MFFPTDLNNQTPEDNRDQSPDPNQYLPTMTVINSSWIFHQEISFYSFFPFRYK